VAPLRIDLNQTKCGFAPLFREAGVERAELVKQLIAHTKDFEKAEATFWQQRHRANVGLALVDASGEIIFRDDS